MAWQALLVGGILGGISNTLSAIDNQKKLKAYEAETHRQVIASLHKSNTSLNRQRAANAVRGFPVSEQVNEARQSDFSIMNSAGLQLDKMRSQVQAGFVNAATNTSINLAESGISYREESAQRERDSRFKSRESKKTSTLEGLARGYS